MKSLKKLTKSMFSWNCVFDTKHGSVLKNESHGSGGLLVLIPKKICPKSTTRNMLRRRVKELFRIYCSDKNNFNFLIKFKKNDIEFVDELKAYLNAKS